MITDNKNYKSTIKCPKCNTVGVFEIKMKDIELIDRIMEKVIKVRNDRNSHKCNRIIKWLISIRKDKDCE
jgi:hypothetical protein